MSTGLTEAALLLLLAVGLVIVFLPELEMCCSCLLQQLANLQKKFRSKETQAKMQGERYDRFLPEHIRRLLQMTLSMGTRYGVRGFFILSAGCSFGAFLIAVRWVSLLLAAAAALCSGLLPYLLLRCMVQERRVASSKEGEILTTELLNHYRMLYCNMQEAISAAAVHMEGAPLSRQLLLNLSRGLQNAASKAEMKERMKEFQFAIGTSWAAILAEDMYLACAEGIRVAESLSDLAVSMQEARKLEEMSRRENNETRLILKYLIPWGGLLMAGCGIRFFGLTAEEFLHYQLGTGPGITWLLITAVSYITAVFLHLLLSRRKFDL